MRKFMIDIRDSHSFPFGLYFFEAGKFFGGSWKEVASFQNRQEAKEFWEKIKDLPEYL